MTWWEKVKRYRSFLVAGTTAAAAIIAAVISVVHWLDTPPPQTKKVVQEISLLRPPPPPPKQEEPPPPPEVEEEVELPEPEDIPDPASLDEPPPGDLLGLDAEGVAGSDGFGLAARKGGRSITDGFEGRYRWYAGVIKQSLLSQLAEVERIRSRRYSIVVSLWLAPDGSIKDVSLKGTTGDSELDSELRMALASLHTVGEVPPTDLPQPVQLQIVSRL